MIDMAGADTSSNIALHWEIPLFQILSATPQTCIVSVLRFLQVMVILAGYLTFPFQRENVENLAAEGYYEYDLRQKNTSTPCPYDFFQKYLNLESVQKAIGAEVPFVISSDPVEHMFNETGDVISLIVSTCNRHWNLRRTLDRV